MGIADEFGMRAGLCVAVRRVAGVWPDGRVYGKYITRSV